MPGVSDGKNAYVIERKVRADSVNIYHENIFTQKKNDLPFITIAH